MMIVVRSEDSSGNCADIHFDDLGDQCGCLLSGFVIDGEVGFSAVHLGSSCAERETHDGDMLRDTLGWGDISWWTR